MNAGHGMSRALRSGGATLREALHAEWTKLRTAPSTGWLLLTAIALTAGAGALATAVVKCPASCGEDTTKLSLTGILLGQAAVAVLAVLVMTGEYSSGMIRTTLTAVPRRATALAAKAIILTGAVLTTGTVSVLGSVLAGRYILRGNGLRALTTSGAMRLPAAALSRSAPSRSPARIG
jgi:ABC-2 type transport system permease protein